MAPPRKQFNPILSRDDAARNKVLQDTGGFPEVIEEPLPETIKTPEFNIAEFGIQEFSPGGMDRFIGKLNETYPNTKFIFKQPSPNNEKQKAFFDALTTTGVQPSYETPKVETEVPSIQPEIKTPEVSVGLPSSIAVKQTSPTQERLSALASILKMTEGDEAARRKAYERTAMDAETGKIMQAMMAGLTRSPVPANVYEPTPAFQPEGRLSLLAKAAQALRGVQDVTERGVAGQNRLATESEKLWLKEKMPSLYQTFESTGVLDTMTEAEWKKYYDGYQGEVKGKRTVEQQEANRELRKELAQIQQASDATKFIQKQISAGKTEAEAIPYLRELVKQPEIVESILSPGSTFRSKFAGGLLSTEEQQRFDQLVEGIAGPFRAGRFGLSQTSAELKNFEKLMGEADRTGNPVLRVMGLRDLVRSMRERLRVNFAAAKNANPDSEIYKQYKAYENEIEMPLFNTLIEQLDDIVANAPAKQQTPWQKIKGAAIETGKTVTGGLTTPQATQPRVQGPVTGPTPAPQTQAPAPARNVDVTKFKRAQVGKEKGWYDVETGVFLTEEEYQALKSGKPATLRPRP